MKEVVFLVDDSSEYKKAKGVHKNVVTISHNEYEGVLLSRKYLRHSINKIKTKNHRIRACEINKIYFSYLDDEIHILNNDGSILSY